MQKKKSGVKKCLEICAIKGGGGGPLMANAILNFHFDFLNPSLSDPYKKSFVIKICFLFLLDLLEYE